MGIVAGTAGQDTLLGSLDADTLDGMDGDDLLDGSSGADSLLGGAGNDTLDGGTGADTLVGGMGDDVYLVDDTRDIVRESVAGGIDEVRTTLTAYTLGTEIERLTFTGTGNFKGTGNALNNLIVGGAGNDTLTGGDGADTLIGGDGDDRFYFDAADAPLQGGAGFDTAVVQGSAGVTLNLAACSIEQVYGGAGNDSLTGTGALLGLAIDGRDGDDLILGSAFADTLTGGNGSDTLMAGDGDDVLYIDADDALVSGGAGFDTVHVQGNGNLTLDLTASGIERVFSGSGNDILTATGSVTLVEINGGAGDDLLVGSAFDDTLRGDAGDDTLFGGAGNDVLVGGGGNNVLFGAAGDDRLYVDTTTASLDGGDGNDTVYARYSGGVTLDLSASIELFNGSVGSDAVTAVNASSAVKLIGGDGDDSLTGGAYADSLRGDNGNDWLGGGDGNDTLTGGGGSDTLDGGTGDDRLVGGTGDDVYIVDSAGDVVVEAVNQGFDEVRTSLAAYTLGANVEALIHTGSGPFSGTGNALDNRLSGADGDDSLSGGTGNDTLIGGAGSDTAVFAGNAHDYQATKTGSTWTIQALTGTEGTDTLQGVEWAQFADARLRLDANNAPLVPGDLTAATDEDAVPLTVDLLQGAWDFEGSALAVTGLAQTGGPAAAVTRSGGVLTLDPGQFNNLGVGQSATLSFAYGVTDGTASTPQTLTVTVQGRNDAPTATDDAFNTTLGKALVLTPSLLLANDRDPDLQDTLSLLSVANATHGTVVIDALGQVIFTPTLGYSGTAGFDYVVSDQHGGIASATATVNVSTPPVSPKAATSLDVKPQVRVAGGLVKEWIATAVLADGSSVVAWSTNYLYAGSDVMARRYDAQGNALGSAVTVNTTTPYDQGRPSIAALGDGGYVITWEGRLANLGPMEIFQQRYDANGLKVGEENRVNTYTSSEQQYATTAALPDGGWLVTWTSYGQVAGGVAEVYQQRYAASGQAVGGEVQVNTATAGSQGSSQVAVLADGGWVVTWESNGQDGNGWGVYQQRYSAAGQAVGGEVQVNTYTAGDQNWSSVGKLNDGGWVVAWQSAGQDGSGRGVYAQIFNADGSRRGNERQINQLTSGEQYHPNVIGLSDGGFQIAWGTSAPGGSGYALYSQRFLADGTATTTQFQISSAIDGDTARPQLAMRPDDGFIIVWNRPDYTTASNTDYELAMRTYTTNSTVPGNYVGTVGNDTLFGSSSSNILTGGAGADAFLFMGFGQGVDTITDFQAGQDRIEVVGSNFGGLSVGQLDAGRFALNTPSDADDRFLFNTATGVLSYDPDGSGSLTAIALAALNVRTLSANAIWVVASP